MTFALGATVNWRRRCRAAGARRRRPPPPAPGLPCGSLRHRCGVRRFAIMNLARFLGEIRADIFGILHAHICAGPSRTAASALRFAGLGARVFLVPATAGAMMAFSMRTRIAGRTAQMAAAPTVRQTQRCPGTSRRIRGPYGNEANKRSLQHAPVQPAPRLIAQG